MTFSFVIPNYNNPDMLKNCLEHIRKLYPTHKIIVVDDASSEIEKIKLVCAEYNAEVKTSFHNNGFSYNCNKGIDALNTDAVVLINNDVELKDDILKESERILNKDSKIGVIGFLLYYPNMQIQHSGIRFKSLESMSHDPKDAPDAFYSRYTIAVTGALMVIRKKMVEEIGGFNAGYKLAFEDTELCLRAWHTGWRVYYTADVFAIHYEGYTRGVTDEQKKNSGTWDKEQDSYKKYLKDIVNYSYLDIINKVRVLP